MPFDPGVSWFVPFHEYDPFTDSRCIYFTQKETRCLWPCSDNKQAMQLHETIKSLPAETVDVRLIEEYILCTCCKSGRAQHRHRIEDAELLIPLAERWKDEIRTRTAGGESRYDLRSHDTNNRTSAISVRPKTTSRPPLSEFRTHIEEPGPGDSVSQKILDKLVDRDFESGSVYIFDRTSSPGYVKIGWTARSISSRLVSWSDCGYTPNLLFSVHHIPHAQRVETLTHFELIKEWRKERRCKAEWCGKSHQEWFEVSKERAEQVLGDWAEFMKVAEPYDSEGFLNDRWKDFVLAMKSGETLTAKKLLEQSKQSLAKHTTLRVNSLFKAKPFLGIEPLHENVTAKRAPAEKSLSPAQILPPPSPLTRPANSREGEIDLSLEMKRLCVTDIITKSNNSSAVFPLSESDALNSSATPSPPTLQTKPKSNHPAPLIKISDDQAEAIAVVSITQSQHNVEEDVQKESKSELLKCDGQESENGTVTTVKDGWDTEVALTEAFAVLKVAE